jgi:hypothetical protein
MDVCLPGDDGGDELAGFLFPLHGVTPAQVLGVLSLIALIIAGLSIYRHHLQGIWRRRTYAITAVMALYFNVFVLVVQLFRRVSALSAADPVGAAFPDSAVRRAAAVQPFESIAGR